MNPEENGPNPHGRIILTSAAVSLLLGVVVAQLFEFDNQGRLHLTSITGEGLLADVLLILSLVLLVISVMRIAAGLRPGHLVTAGILLVISAVISPAFFASVSSTPKTEMQQRRAFVIAAIVEFIGACCLGSGLRGIVANRRKSTATNKGRNKQ